MRILVFSILAVPTAIGAVIVAALAAGDLKADTVRIEAPYEPVNQVFQAPEVTLTRVDNNTKELSSSVKKSIVDTCSQSVANVYYNRSRIYLKCLQDALAQHGYTAEFKNEDELYIILNSDDAAKHPAQ